MQKIMNNVVKTYGLAVGKLAITIATISPACCRGEWYQPKEPERLREILKRTNQQSSNSL
jgi:cyclic lactone autoinducer peptide